MQSGSCDLLFPLFYICLSWSTRLAFIGQEWVVLVPVWCGHWVIVKEAKI